VTFTGLLHKGSLSHPFNETLNVSSQLISICPDGNRRPVVMLVSKHIALLLYEVVLRHDYQKFWQYFNQFWQVSRSHGAAGWLWEAHAIHRVLGGSDASESHSLIALTQPHSDPLPVELPFRKIRHYGDVKSLARLLAEIVPSLRKGDSCLFVPGASNQTTSDAFAVSAALDVSLFQAAVAEDGKHSLKVKGFDFIWDAVAEATKLTESALLRSLLPTKAQKWALIFVVPQRVSCHWIRPQSIDFGGVQPKRAWDDYIEQYDNIEQYVMALDDNGSTEIADIVGSSLGKRGQDEKMEVLPKRTKAAQVEKDDEAEEADAPKGERKMKATSPRSKRKVKKSGQVAGGSK
jgi:hypothetical protein